MNQRIKHLTIQEAENHIDVGDKVQVSILPNGSDKEITCTAMVVGRGLNGRRKSDLTVQIRGSNSFSVLQKNAKLTK